MYIYRRRLGEGEGTNNSTLGYVAKQPEHTLETTINSSINKSAVIMSGVFSINRSSLAKVLSVCRFDISPKKLGKLIIIMIIIVLAHLGSGMGHLTHNLFKGGRLLHLFLIVQCDFLAELSRVRSHFPGCCCCCALVLFQLLGALIKGLYHSLDLPLRNAMHTTLSQRML